MKTKITTPQKISFLTKAHCQKKRESKFSRTHTRSGTSLLIALGLVTLIILVSIGVTSIIISSIRDSNNVNRANQAYYAAEGALEDGLLENQQSGAGYTGGITSIAYCPPSKPNCSKGSAPEAAYNVKGQVPSNTKYSDGTYGIPTPGTGTAGFNCDPLNPVVSGNFEYPAGSGNPEDAKNHPCNWNTIKVGESVSIPLYVTEADGSIKNPIDLGLSVFRIRVRTPCSNGSDMCTDAERYKLDDTKGDSFFKCDTNTLINCGDTIMSWEITGTNKTGEKVYTLLPNKGYKINGQRLSNNSEIYESKINKQKGTIICPYCLLVETNSGFDIANTLGLLKDFLLDGVPSNGTGGISFIRTGNDRIQKPTLKLKLIHTLQEYGTGKTLPYLEYQVLTDSVNAPPPDSAQTITSEGFSGIFKQVLEIKKPQEGGVLEYVIQQ